MTAGVRVFKSGGAFVKEFQQQNPVPNSPSRLSGRVEAHPLREKKEIIDGWVEEWRE
jgi:hypothetical protein